MDKNNDLLKTVLPKFNIGAWDRRQQYPRCSEDLYKLPIYPDELIHWTEAIETTAKNMSKNKTDGIRFRYDIDEKDMKFFLKDPIYQFNTFLRSRLYVDSSCVRESQRSESLISCCNI